MEKFLFLIREDVKKLDQFTEEEFDKCIREMTIWVESLAQSGNFISGEPLLTRGKYVKFNHIISDGPFIEAKEAVSGYVMIKAENLDQAASIAQTCPRVLKDEMAIEVRPIMALMNERINALVNEQINE